MAAKTSDLSLMRLAIKEARRSVPEDGRVHPWVGAVVVKDGQVLASSCRGDLEPGDHAEFTLLEKKLVNRALTGSTVYTTLEPCTTRKHPKVPCADRLIEHRVSRVVIGMLDPNQVITGKGILKLRRAGIAVDLFPSELMAELEELNRDFIRAYHSNEDGRLSIGVSEAGLSAFYPSRDFYSRLRPDAPTIDTYVRSAKHSAVLVSINLMTGIPFDDLCRCLGEKLGGPRSRFRATISLLSPWRSELMLAMAPILKMKSVDLAKSIRESLRELHRFKGGLPKPAQERFEIRVHNALPFGSAIMLDHHQPSGHIQIETKPYKAGLRHSFAFEVVRSHEDGLYAVLARAYDSLVKDGSPVPKKSLYRVRKANEGQD